jgi:probable HAF family extracellular repeat protein
MRRVVFVLATVALVGCRSAVQPTPASPSLLTQLAPGDYEIVDLGTLDTTHHGGGGGGFALAANNRGQVVGWSRTGIGDPEPYGAQHAFLWENGVMQDIQALGRQGGASVINDEGQVVAWYFNELGRRAFLWEGGVARDLGTLGGNQTEARSINNNGQVAGWSQTTGGAIHAFLWLGGVMRDLGTLGGSSSEATNVNEAEQVVGSSQTAAGETHAFLWEQGVMQDLGTLGGTSSAAAAVSEEGYVTGYSTDSNGQQHAFRWRNGVMQDLGLLPGYTTTSGVVVNARGDVAGQATNPPSYYTHGFFWARGVMHDLGTFGGPSTYVSAVNARGLVVGTSLRSGCSCSERAFGWQDGVLLDLGTLPRYLRAMAFATNNRGDVTGMSSLYPGSDAFHPVLWRRLGAAPVENVASSQSEDGSTSTRR